MADNIRKRIEGEVQTKRYSFRARRRRRDRARSSRRRHGVSGPAAVIGTLLDITDPSGQAQIVYHAYHDPLTELPNRMPSWNGCGSSSRRPAARAVASRSSTATSTIKFVSDTLGTASATVPPDRRDAPQGARARDGHNRPRGRRVRRLIPDVSRAEDISIISQKLLTSSPAAPGRGRALQITASIGVPATRATARTPSRPAQRGHRVQGEGSRPEQLPALHARADLLSSAERPGRPAPRARPR